MEFKQINKASGEDLVHNNETIASFLHTHLEEYGDEKADILKCLDYVFAEHRGGHIFLGLEGDKIIGAVVINFTHMDGYIPENILVYIAFHKDYRGRGLGKQLMQKAIQETEGNIALHVEPNNPALHLYKKLGFENKYLEMRLNKA